MDDDDFTLPTYWEELGIPYTKEDEIERRKQEAVLTEQVDAIMAERKQKQKQKRRKGCC